MLRRDISQGEIGILPLDPLCSLPCYIQHSSSQLLINGGGCRPLKRFLRYTQKSSSNAGWLRSTPVGFAAFCRSVCRNLSCKLPSHAFAALTGLVAVGSLYYINRYWVQNCKKKLPQNRSFAAAFKRPFKRTYQFLRAVWKNLPTTFSFGSLASRSL